MGELDGTILNETFEIYMSAAKKAEADNNLTLAKRNYLFAAETLLKMAKGVSPALKEARVLRARKIVEKAESLTQVESLGEKSNTENGSQIKIQNNEKVSLNDALGNLNQLEGLATVKEQVLTWIDQIKVFQMRKNCGLSVPEMTYHMVFTGNPGTGKTTVARIIAQIYCALGILSKGQLVEVDRSALVAGFVGQTAIKTKNVIQKAIGGVLFIDEAYSLSNGQGNDFGQEAIDTILKEMEDNRNDLVVIVAGYSGLMDKFISSNPGLRSRFKNFIHFQDYTPNELLDIFINYCEKNQYSISDSARNILFNYLQSIYDNRSANFGNARDVRNLFETVITNQSKRVANMANPTVSDISLILAEDMPFDVSLYNKSSINDKKDENKQISKGNKKNQSITPEEAVLKGNTNSEENESFIFDWNSLPTITFDDVAGLEDVKETVKIKVLLPLKNPEAVEGYAKKSGGGLLLYGPPGTGKTMIAAAIANEIGAKFCSVKPSDLLHQGAGNTEKAVRALFAQARKYPCAVIYFDEMDSISPKSTKSQYAKQLRSELLAQLQGIESYGKDNGNILFLIAATNKPWEIDSAFIRPGRFGTRVYVGLPDACARRYIIENRLNKLKEKGIVEIRNDIILDDVISETEGFNGSDLTNYMDKIEEISILRSMNSGEKYIEGKDFEDALKEIKSSVQKSDIEKLMAWKGENN